MPDGSPQDLSREIRRRMKQSYKRSLFAVIPLVLTTLGVWAHAPTPLVIACFWAIWVGIVICMISIYQLNRCPACNHFLVRPLGLRRCPHCHAPFQPDKA